MITIDPGTSGGIVIGSKRLKLGPLALPMPNTDRVIANLLEPPSDWDQEDKTAYIEDLIKFTGVKMPSSSMATYASNWGFIKGVLTAHKFRIVVVHPKKWQAALGLGTATGKTKTQWKNKLKNLAEQLYPQLKVTLATADALLIYEAAQRHALG